MLTSPRLSPILLEPTHGVDGSAQARSFYLLILLPPLFVARGKCRWIWLPDLKHRPVMNLHEERGFTMSTTFVAPCASVVGDVRIIDHSCVWYGAVVRGTLGGSPTDSLHFTAQRKQERCYPSLGRIRECAYVVCEDFVTRERHTQ